MSGNRSRAKGARGERALAEELRKHGYLEARRGGMAQACRHGATHSPDVIGVNGVHIECKYAASLNPYSALEQAQKDAAPSELAVVMHKRVSKTTNASKPWIVILTLDDFLALYKKGEEEHAQKSDLSLHSDDQ